MANSPFVLEFSFDGVTQVATALSRFGEYARDLRPAYREISADFKKIAAETFSHSGPGWAPLSPTYAAWKGRHFPGKPILVRTGELQTAITGGSGYVEKLEPLIWQVGVRHPAATFHQRGTSRMPARKLVDFRRDPSIQRRWAKIVQRHLVAESRRAGLNGREA